MFSLKEILEDFAERVECAIDRRLSDLSETDRTSEHLTISRGGFWDPHPAADAFLKASEEEREALRRAPRVIPKDVRVSLDEPETIRKAAETHTQAELAKRLKCHRHTIARIVARKDRPKKAPKAVREILIAQRAEGYSARELAQRYCLSESYVYSILKRGL